jgi:hypothetical protein
MAQSDSTCLTIDLNHFKLHLNLPGQKPLSLHFDTPSRRFYISVMALVLEEMKKTGKVSFVPLEKHAEILIGTCEDRGDLRDRQEFDLHLSFRCGC